MKSFSPQNSFGQWIMSIIQGYNHNKYWKRRAYVIDPSKGHGLYILLKLYFLFYIKRTDARHNSSFGTNMNSGAQFKTPPYLLHGPNGIIVGHDTILGRNVTIAQQVTIFHGGVVVGDNVLIGAGAKIISGVHIGNNVKIGANCVVVQDIPDNATVVMQKPRIILRE